LQEFTLTPRGPTRAQSQGTAPERHAEDDEMTADLQQLTTEIPIESLRKQGVVRWFSLERGYGFIAPDEGGEDVFVRFSSVAGEGFRQLVDGQRVTYELGDDGRGPRALDVRPA
jgi:cold shock protein